MPYCLVYVRMFSSFPVAPTINIIPPQNVTVQKGFPGSMTCVIVGDYNSEVTPWTHNETRVKTGKGVTVENALVGNGMAVFSLTFMNVTDNNTFGEYTCAGLGQAATAYLIKGPSGELVLSRYICT